VEIILPLGFRWRSLRSRPNSPKIFLMSAIPVGLEISVQFEYLKDKRPVL
jgi:hypothetical protein